MGRPPGPRWTPWSAPLVAAFATLLAATLLFSNLRGARFIESSLEPVLAISDSGLGGLITEVCAHPGDRVQKGQVLVRLDASRLRLQLEELQATERLTKGALDGRGVLQRVPERLRRYLYETHPDVVQAEYGYVKALDDFETSPGPERKAQLSAAAQQRTNARRKLDRVLASAGVHDEMTLMLRNVQKNRAEIERLLNGQDVRASADGFVDILDLKPGDRIFPRVPAAAVRVSDEYTSDLIVPNATNLRVGARISGTAATGAPFSGIVESLASRKVPAAFREDRNIDEETVARVRVHSSRPFLPGTACRFLLP